MGSFKATDAARRLTGRLAVNSDMLQLKYRGKELTWRLISLTITIAPLTLCELWHLTQLKKIKS